MNSPLIIPAAAFLALLGTSPLLSAGDSALRYPDPADAKLYTVCWTGSQYVAGGQGGVVLTSSDGVTWTPRHCGEASHWRASAAGGGKIVLWADSGVVVTSADGITWTSPVLPKTGTFSNLAFNTARDVAWNGTVFMVTSGTGDDAWSSPDGISWTHIASGVDNYFRGLAVKGTQFASFDAGVNSPVLKSKLWTSTGGAWTAVQTDTLLMEELVWTGDRYIAISNGGAATSVDGITWTPRSTGVSMEVKHLIWTGTQAVAVGGGGKIITSPNGATWTPQVSGTAKTLHSVAWSGSKLVAVGEDGLVLTSITGSAWETVREGVAQAVAPGFVGWTGTSALALGAGGTLHSPDGSVWAKAAASITPPASGNPNGPSNTPYRFRLASHAGRVVAAISDDAYSSRAIWITDPQGTSWTQAASPVPDSSTGLAVVWNGSEFTALTTRRVLNLSGFWQFTRYRSSSPDGLVWTAQSVPSPENGTDLVWTGQAFVSASDMLIWTGNQLVNISRDGSRRTSSDGTTWSAPYSSPGDSVQEVVWTGSRLLALTSHSVYEAPVAGPWQLVSKRGGTGITWTGTRALVATGGEIFSLEGIGLSAWSAWLATYFTPAQLSDAALTGPLADPDHDRQTNLVEFATGTNPANPTDTPVITTVNSPQGLRFRWPQNTGVTNASITPQVSFDLDTWDNLTGTPVSGTPGGIRVMESAPLSNQQKAFLRLRVQLLD